MKTYEEIHSYYKRFHTNPKNVLIHRATVPLIFLGAYGLLVSIPVPAFIAHIPGVNWGNLVLILLLIYFAQFSLRILGIMYVFLAAIVTIVLGLNLVSPISMTPIYSVIFIGSWVFQIVGQKIEGKRPAFLDDLHALPLGLILAYSQSKKSST